MVGRTPFLMRMFSETITLRVSWAWKCSTVYGGGWKLGTRLSGGLGEAQREATVTQCAGDYP